jgi:hypothetical protein
MGLRVVVSFWGKTETTRNGTSKNENETDYRFRSVSVFDTAATLDVLRPLFLEKAEGLIGF